MGHYRIIENNYPYFLTESIVGWLPIFVSSETCDIAMDSLSFYRQNRQLNIHAYVIMPTHLHLILSSEQDLFMIIRDFKRYTAKKIVQYYVEKNDTDLLSQFKKYGNQHHPSVKYKIWQDGSHPEIILKENFFHQKVDYLHDNPRRKRFVDSGSMWKYLSAGSYTGTAIEPLIDIDWIEW